MSLAARQRLYDEAIAFACGDINDRGRQRILCEAAKAYARAFDETARNPPGAPPSPSPSPSPSSASNMTVPFGRDKGKRLSEVDDLSWLRRVVGKSVDDEAKQRFRAQNVALLDAIEAEIGRRGES